MSIITFTSDLGLSDAYVAITKARILEHFPQARIVDISHLIEPANIADGAFVLATSYREFPEGSIHLIAIDTLGQQGDQYVAVRCGGHFFVGTDNGLISLVAESQPEAAVVLEDRDNSAFPAKDVLAPAAARLAAGVEITDLGQPAPNLRRLLGRQVKATKKEIAGHVVKVDHYGNLITSIKKLDFDILSKDRRFVIGFGRETVTEVQTGYNQVEAGDVYVCFNYMGLMEIGIRNGNAAQLLGLRFDSPVWIKFDD